MSIEFIIIFVIVILSEIIGFWSGLRSQKKKVTKDIKKLAAFTKKQKTLKKENESGIIKSLTPEQFETERRQKFEKENY